MDAVIAPDDRFVFVLTGAHEQSWTKPEPGATEYMAASVAYFPLGHRRQLHADVVWAPLPDPMPDLFTAQLLPTPELVGEYTVRIRLPQGTVVEHVLDAKSFAPPVPDPPRWVAPVERPRVHATRRQIFGDFGRPLLATEIEVPSAVDFEPLPVAACNRSADGLVAFTLRPRVGPEPTGILVHCFSGGGSGVSAIWNEATGALVHVFDEPGEVQWLADDVILVFHADGLEALRWPELHRLWRIPLASPLRGPRGPGVPAMLAISTARDLAVTLWERPFAEKHNGQGRIGYTLVDLGERPAQRLGSGYQTNWCELARGPVFSPDDRLLVLSLGYPYWFRDGADSRAYRRASAHAWVGTLVVHDVVVDGVARKNIETRTPEDFAEPAWLGSDVVGPARFDSVREITVDLPTGGTWSFDLAKLPEITTGMRRPAPTPPRPRVSVAFGEGERRAVFPVPFEVDFELAGVALWARRASWSESFDRVAMALSTEGERGLTQIAGVWDPRTGDLIESTKALGVAIGPESSFIVLKPTRLCTFAWPRLEAVDEVFVGEVTDFVVAPHAVIVAMVAEGGTEIRVHVAEKDDLLHTTRRRSTFRGPCWSSDGRFVVIAAFAATTETAGELIVVEIETGHVRETALPEALAATTLDVTVENTVRLGTASWRLAEIAPAGASSYLPIPLVIPTSSGYDAAMNTFGIPDERLRAQGATILPDIVAELWDERYEDQGRDRRGVLAGLAELFTTSPLAEAAVLTIPFLAAVVADEETPLREALVDLLVRVRTRAEDDADDRAIAAFRASRDWLIAGAATSPELGELLAM